MKSLSTSQLTFNFEPSLPERFPSLRAFIAHRVALLPKSAKTIAADMDMAPSTLSRKLNPGEGDTSRFNCDDLESFLSSSGDAAAVIEYLCSKFCDSADARKARMLAKVESLSSELAVLVSQLKAPTK